MEVSLTLNFRDLATECIKVVSGAKKSETKLLLTLKLPMFRASTKADRLKAVWFCICESMIFKVA